MVFASGLSPITTSTRAVRSEPRAAGAPAPASAIPGMLGRGLVNTDAQVAAEHKRPAGRIAPNRLSLVIRAEENQETGVRPERLPDPHQANRAARCFSAGPPSVGHRRDAGGVDTGFGYGKSVGGRQTL